MEVGRLSSRFPWTRPCPEVTWASNPPQLEDTPPRTRPPCSKLLKTCESIVRGEQEQNGEPAQ